MKQSFKAGNSTIVINTDEAAEDISAVLADIEEAVSRGLSRKYGVDIRARLVNDKSHNTT